MPIPTEEEKAAALLESARTYLFGQMAKRAELGLTLARVLNDEATAMTGLPFTDCPSAARDAAFQALILRAARRRY